MTEAAANNVATLVLAAIKAMGALGHTADEVNAALPLMISTAVQYLADMAAAQ